MNVSVIIPTHNPRPDALRQTIAALRRQTLPAASWECVVVDNASTPPISPHSIAEGLPANFRIIHEAKLGLTAARCAGITAAAGDFIVFVDDDNELAPDYLSVVEAALHGDPSLGAIGGRITPEFATPPNTWVREFDSLLAVRDAGPALLRADWRDGNRIYPHAAPVGAGMAIRRDAALNYAAAIATDSRRGSLDRKGNALVSGGDNDLIMTVLEQGYATAYLPALQLRHLIPAGRCQRCYLGQLNRAIARSWVRVLALHHIRPWPPIKPATQWPRMVRAWFRRRAWAGPANWVRWQGDCGHFEGLADLYVAEKLP